MTRVQSSLAILSAALCVSSSLADLDTNPYLFTELAAPVTGQFGWDEFEGSVFAPFAPDVGSAGVGSAALSIAYTPGFGIVTSTDNLYDLGNQSDFTISLTGLETSGANTTVVWQGATLGDLDFDSILLDGAAPTELVDRFRAPGVLHDTDGVNAAFNTHYYWAEWQVPAAASYDVTFTNAHTHMSFTQARVDYVNSASAYNAATPALVPEPSAVAIAGLALGLLSARRHR